MHEREITCTCWFEGKLTINRNKPGLFREQNLDSRGSVSNQPDSHFSTTGLLKDERPRMDRSNALDTLSASKGILLGRDTSSLKQQHPRNLVSNFAQPAIVTRQPQPSLVRLNENIDSISRNHPRIGFIDPRLSFPRLLIFSTLLKRRWIVRNCCSTIALSLSLRTHTYIYIIYTLVCNYMPTRSGDATRCNVFARCVSLTANPPITISVHARPTTFTGRRKDRSILLIDSIRVPSPADILFALPSL